MDPKCAWTGKRSSRAVKITVDGVDRIGRPAPPEVLHVLPEHEQDLRAFAGRARRFGSTFLVAVLALTLGMVAAAVLGGAGVWSTRVTAVVVGMLVSLQGFLFVAMPFATPETVQMMGIRRAMLLVRVLGLFTIALGVVIGFLG